MKQRNVFLGAGVALILAGVVVGAKIPLFYLHNYLAGQRLTHKAVALFSGTGNTSASATPANQVSTTAGGNVLPLGQSSQGPAPTLVSTIPLALPSNDTLFGLLTVPKLQLEAPIVQGTDGTVLNSAIGHLTDSSMPGQPGMSVLAAHNATWFRHVDRLIPGDTIVVHTRSGIFTYQVTGHQVVHTGTTLPATAAPELILESCYPLDALYLTPQRYLVYAKLTGVNTSTTSVSANTAAGKGGMNGNPSSGMSPGSSTMVRAQVPADLQAEGLLLHENSLPLGTITYQGSPSLAFTQSSVPLQITNTMVQLFEAYLHAVGEEKAADVHSLLPNQKVDANFVSGNPLWGTALSRVTFVDPLSFQVTLGKADEVQLVQATTIVNVNGQSYEMKATAKASYTGSAASVGTKTPSRVVLLHLAQLTIKPQV